MGMKDIESRIGVGSVEEHTATWLRLSREAAPLRAIHGTNGRGGIWDAQRKANVSKIKMLLRAEAAMAAGTGKKSSLTVDEVDALAHADPRYTQFITEAVKERTRLSQIEAELEAIQFVLNREQAAMRAYAAEPR